MQLTKYEHACFVITKDNQSLVIDPGVFTTDFVVPSDVVGIVITHQHTDHFDRDKITQLHEQFPQLLMIVPSDVAEMVPEGIRVHVASPGETLQCGAFTLQFFGGEHALIQESMPRPHNLGVLIDHSLYYPGDSLVVPDVAVDTLALPVVAPWLKIGETMDFLIAVHPRFAFPTHDAVASAAGKALVDRMLGSLAGAHDITYQRLETPIEIPKK